MRAVFLFSQLLCYYDASVVSLTCTFCTLWGFYGSVVFSRNEAKNAKSATFLNEVFNKINLSFAWLLLLV